MENGILIGCHQGLSGKEIKFIHDKVINFLNKNLINIEK